MSAPDSERPGFKPMSICLLIVTVICCVHTPALAGTVTFNYDRFGNIQTAIYPDDNSIQYVHNAAGNGPLYSDCRKAPSPLRPEYPDMPAKAAHWKHLTEQRQKLAALF
jgi:hypothetical protein